MIYRQYKQTEANDYLEQLLTVPALYCDMRYYVELGQL